MLQKTELFLSSINDYSFLYIVWLIYIQAWQSENPVLYMSPAMGLQVAELLGPLWEKLKLLSA